MATKNRTVWTFVVTSAALFMVTLDNLVVTTALPVIRARPARQPPAAGVDGERIHADVRGAAAHRRGARRSLRPAADLLDRPRAVHARFGGVRARAEHRPADRGACGAGCRRGDGDTIDTNHPERGGVRRATRAWRSARGAASAASPSRSVRSSVAPSSRASPGTGSSGSTCRSASRCCRSRGPARRDARRRTAISTSAGLLIASAGLFAIVLGPRPRQRSRAGRARRSCGRSPLGVALMVAVRRLRAALPRSRCCRSATSATGRSAAPTPPRCSCSSGCSAASSCSRSSSRRCRDYSPLHAGLRILPWTAMPIIVAPTAGALSDRINGRTLHGDRARAAGHRPALDRPRHHPDRRRTRTSSCRSSSAASAWACSSRRSRTSCSARSGA